jgi:hypothetical protein
MDSLTQLKTLVSCGREPARPLPLRRGFLLIPLVLVSFAFLPQMQAAPDALHPPPDGCYSNFTTAEGCGALNFLTTGPGNTADGWYALYSDTSGAYNVGVGAGALILNNADSNTAVGAVALLLNTTGTGATTGTQNVAVGTDALVFNAGGAADFSGSYNNAVGAFALFDNEDGYSNNALGNSALKLNVHAAGNTAIGDAALGFNDSSLAGLANGNTAVGFATLYNNVDGSDNTAVGDSTGQNVVAGFENTYVGDFVGSTEGDESNTIRIGDISNGNGAGSLECYIGGIWNNLQPVNGTTIVQVTLDLTNDHLGYDFGPNGGSAPMPHRAVPVPRSAPQPRARPQFQAMLNDKVEKLQATVAQQQKQIDTLTAQLKEQAETFTAQLKEQAAQIQKVGAQLETVKPAPRVVENR